MQKIRCVVLLGLGNVVSCRNVKIWDRLKFFRNLKLKKRRRERPIVGVLGCMAERLKETLLEEKQMVDVVAGPDAYRDLPRLLHIAQVGCCLPISRHTCTDNISPSLLTTAPHMLPHLCRRGAVLSMYSWPKMRRTLILHPYVYSPPPAPLLHGCPMMRVHRGL